MPDTQPGPADEQAYRLPRTVTPSRYELAIEPDLDTATFRGTEDVTVTVSEAVDRVVLNAVELDVEAAWLEGPGGRLDGTVSLDEASERLTVALSGTADAGTWTLHLEFRGVLNDKLRGLYRSRFTDESGTERVIATTQMEPTDARRAFPCWDEPDLKATFAVTLVVDEGLLAVSNGALVGTEPRPDGRTAWRFAETIPMSTYLVAFVVGPLEATEPRDVDGVPLRIVHVPGKGDLTEYGAEVGDFCLRFFADWYGIPYPSDKVDLLALPDFAAGAMENLGAITFREALLLVDPDAVTRAELQRVADVVAHELAHMWFGDLVTMKWWNGLWLNEAFATFMELLAVDAFRPDWERWVSFSLERSAAMDVDALESTRPIEYPVHSPEDAEGMFDVLTYQKGASVLRMLERYLGEPTFREGIRGYLKAREYGNAETTDLWDAIEAAAGDPVRRIMDSWIFQGGYPVVGVERTDGGVRLSQERFRFDGQRDGSRWSVPVMLRAGDGDHRRLLEGSTVDVDLDGSTGAVVVNAGGHGFYRVRYSPELLAEITAVAHTDLSPIERYLLVDDTWAAVLAGRTPATAFLDLAAGFEPETDRTVWAALLHSLGELHAVLDDATRPRLQAFVRKLVGPAAARLGWETAPGDDELTRQLRGTLLMGLGVLGEDTEVQARARDILELHRGEAGAVDPNVAAAAIAIVAHAGDATDYERYLETFRSSPSPQEQLRYLYALAGFRSPELVDRTLAMTTNGDVRTQNAPFLLHTLLAQRDAGPRAWAFVKREWDTITSQFPDNTIPRFLGGVTALSTPDLAADVEAFLTGHPVPQGAKQIAQHLERLRVNTGLRQREATAVAGYLS